MPETTLEPVAASSATRAAATVLVCLPSLPPEVLEATLAALAEALPGESLGKSLLVASPDHSASRAAVEFLPYPAPKRPDSGWTLTVGDYAAAAALSASLREAHPGHTLLLLGEDPDFAPATLRDLIGCVRDKGIDLALPRFSVGPADGLVNTALLYPLTRALFSTDIHFPLTNAVALSPRMAARMALSAQRQVTLGQSAALVWPVPEAAIAGYSVREVEAAHTLPPRPRDAGFNALFQTVAASLFADIEARATFWQRARSVLVPAPDAAPATDLPQLSAEVEAEVHSMIESFRLAHTNLQEIWSLVLPPQSRLALKKLANLPEGTFDLAPNLWARLVYDFTLAFHLRTLNRAHLLGAMTPLYLAWAASHLRSVGEDSARAARRTQETALAFENEKSYLVSRWRWPDRFNP